MAYHRKRVGEVDDDRLKFEISTVISKEVIVLCNDLNIVVLSNNKLLSIGLLGV